jgi:hypothetical protein
MYFLAAIFILIENNAHTPLEFSMDVYNFSNSKNVIIKYDNLNANYNDSLKHTYDAFRFEMTMGVNNYNKENFDNAIFHFEKAYQINTIDTLVQEYLYLSYLCIKRYEDANSLARTFSPAMKIKIKYKKRWGDLAAISGGYTFSNNISNGKSNNIKGNENIYGEALYNGDVKWANVSLQNSLLSRLRISYAGSLYNTEALGVVQAADTAKTLNFVNNHQQYNISLSYQFRRGWNITGGFANYQQEISWLTSEYNTSLNKYRFIDYSKRNSYYAGSISISKRMRYAQTSISGTISNFNKAYQLQGESSLVLYPLGNLKFYTTSSVAYFKEKDYDKWIVSQAIGSKVFHWLWQEVKFSYGNLFNYITNNTFVTYNTSDPYKMVVGGNLRFFLKPFEIVVGYNHNKCEGTYFYYNSFTTYKVVKYNYSSQSINTTVVWKF